jgi:hypothetical protein
LEAFVIVKLFPFLIVSFSLTFTLKINATSFSDKKGVGLSVWQERNNGSWRIAYANNAADKVNILNPQWYYTWHVKKLDQITSLKFYPMVFGHDSSYNDVIIGKSLTTWNQLDYVYDRINWPGYEGASEVILLYNEPDNHGDPTQVNLSPEDAATYVDQNQTMFNNFGTTTIVPPVPYNILTNGKLNWVDDYFNELNIDHEIFHADNSGSLIIPIHYYPDPFKFNFINSSSDLSSLSSNTRNRARNKIVNDFMRIIHGARRSYNAKLMITEFGIADWEVDNPQNSLPNDRIPRSFIVEVITMLMNEFSARDYVTHYALFTNDVDYGEGALHQNASFKTRHNDQGELYDITESRLTSVGTTYKDYVYSSNCRKGEFLLGQNRIEYFSSACGETLVERFGYEWNGGNGNNGWIWNGQHQQWDRSLNDYEAGYFPHHLTQNTQGEICQHYRYRSGTDKIEEYINSKCSNHLTFINLGGYSAIGWDNGSPSSWKKTFDIEQDKVGVMEFSWLY